MNDIEISGLIKEWITHKINNPKYKIEEFILDKYIYIKKSSTDNIEELKKSFLKRIDIWKENSYDFEEFVGKQNLYISASQEQSSEMLDNVINELDMDIKEQYHYMSNIKMLIYSSMVEKLDDSLKSEISNILEENYNNEWEMADEGVSEKELQDMFSETSYLLSYIGVDYSSQTRKILAEIGVGHSAYFENKISGEYRNDICILTNFIVSEMVLNDEKFECTEYEKRDIVEKVIPVCVSSMSMAENETDDNNYIKIAITYLSNIFSNRRINFLVKAMLVLVSVKIFINIIKLIILGQVICLTIGNIWRSCNSVFNSRDISVNKLFNKFILRKNVINTEELNYNNLDTMVLCQTEEKYDIE